MAKMIPPLIGNHVKSNAERIIFNLFNRDPGTDGWVVLHSLGLSHHVKRLYGEIDFLVLAPGKGIYCLEVKGGDVKCKDGMWYFTNRYGQTTKKSRSPFMQAQENMFSLKNSIAKKFGSKSHISRLVCGYGVMFPNILFESQEIEHEWWQIYDKDNKRSPISNYVNQLAKHSIKKVENSTWFSKESSLPSDGVINKLVNYLRGDFERLLSTTDTVNENVDQINEFTAEQYACLDQLQDNDRCLFKGAAGTGKTMIAIESVRRSRFKGDSVLFICFNKLLGSWLKGQFERSINNDSLTVGSFHSVIFNLVSSTVPDLKSDSNTTDFLEFDLPLKTIMAVDDGLIPLYDKIIIDEGQDLMREEYLDVIDSLVTGGLAGGKWEIYCDLERQAIYNKMPPDEMLKMIEQRGSFAKFKLNINCRNSGPIGKETALMSGFEALPFLPANIDGPPVDYCFYISPDDQTKKIEIVLSKLINSGVPRDKITILSPLSWESSAASKVNHKVKQMPPIYNEYSGNDKDGHIFFATVQGFKGMENAYIVLADINMLGNDEFRSILYTGMSRAIIGLYIMINQSARSTYNHLLKAGWQNH